MKAAQINSYGASDIIEVTQDAPTPSPTAGQIQVAVHAASLNPFDWKIRAGYMKDMLPLSFPVTLGGDFAGIVTEVADGVTDFKKGDEVYGQANVAGGGSGSLAEFVTSKVSNIALKPKTLDFTKSASLPLVGASAIQAIEEHIKLQSGQKILIHGGAGGIGSLAIQLAKLHGAYVITTVSKESESFVKELGADEVMDYQTQGFETMVNDVDAVFDTVGGETLTKSFAVLKKNGILVTMAGMPDEAMAKQHEITAIGQMTSVTTEKLNRLSELVDTNKIQVQIDKVFPLLQVKEAFDYLEKSHPKGKVVITITE